MSHLLTRGGEAAAREAEAAREAAARQERISSFPSNGAQTAVTAALKSKVKIVSVYAEKGGVGKTTQSASLAWAMTQVDQGKTVLMYDCDSQRSLTNWLKGDEILQFNSYEEFVNRTDLHPNDNVLPRTLARQLDPVRNNNAVTVQPAYAIQIRERLYLVPGDRQTVKYDAYVAQSDALMNFQPMNANVQGAAYHAIIATAEAVKADYVILDLNPQRGSFNRCLVLSSHFIVVAVIADFFSFEMMRDFTQMMTDWRQEHEANRVILQASAVQAGFAEHPSINFPFPRHTPKFLGYVLSRYVPQTGHGRVLGQVQANGLANDHLPINLREWSERILEQAQSIRHNLEIAGMSLPQATYDTINRSVCLGMVSDFNTLSQLSGFFHRPAAYLLPEHFIRGFDDAGRPLPVNDNEAIDQQTRVIRFRNIEEACADTIMRLIFAAPATPPF